MGLNTRTRRGLQRSGPGGRGGGPGGRGGRGGRGEDGPRGGNGYTNEIAMRIISLDKGYDVVNKNMCSETCPCNNEAKEFKHKSE